jgi:intracellular sulfur oxidation DsrE/DsrF family protein
MKKLIVMLCSIIFFGHTAFSQHPDYKVVFDITSKDSSSQQAVVREVNLIKSANPDAKLEVVVYGQALNLVLKDESSQAAPIQQLLSQKDISFKVCALTMKRNNKDKSSLLPGVEIVPDGIYEIITKQKEGWGYIKVAH